MDNLESNDLFDKVLRLPQRKRAELAAAIIASLDSEPTESQEVVDAAWGKEIRRRIDRIEREGSRGVPLEAVREKFKARFSK